jgi:hypothetical protein
MDLVQSYQTSGSEGCIYPSSKSRPANAKAHLGSVVIDDVLSWLSGGVFEPDDIPEHEPGTCAWIYRTAAWKDWEASAFKKALLVTGKAGK